MSQFPCVDVEQLIAQVKARPVIWDRCHDEHKTRTAVLRAWREVSASMMPDFDSLEKNAKEIYSKMLMKKWTNVKDSWIRWNKKINEQKKKGCGSRISKLYVYNSALQFLKKNYVGNEVVVNSDEENEVEENWIKGVSMSPTNIPNRSYVLETSAELACSKKQTLPEHTTSSVTVLSVDEDRHMSFFKGILPSLRLLPEDNVLEFQVGVLNILKGLKTAQKY